MIKLVWTNNNLPLSTIIQLATGEKESHFSVIFDDKLVVQSNLFGVGIAWFNSFKRMHNVLRIVDVKCTPEQEKEVLSSLLDNFDGKRYDFFGLLYFGWCILKNRLFDVPMPKRNMWGRKDAFLCTEIAECLPNWVVPIVHAPGLITPGDLYVIIKKFHLEKTLLAVDGANAYGDEE